jgi:uncharacterized membrane protein YphA (DoxX/SURF4 family)
MDVLTLAPRLLLVLTFAASGVFKFAGGERGKARWSHYRLPDWFRLVTGSLELVASAGLIAGLWIPLLGWAALALIAATMIGAMYSHLVRAGDNLGAALPASILLILSGVVGAGL